ncbi:MAG: ABC transporter ATP-binding protein [Promethearchaeota archaeon]
MAPRFNVDVKKYNGKIDSKTLWKWMFSYLKKDKKLFIVLTIFLIVFSSIQAYLPVLQKILIDDGIIGDNISLVWRILIIYLLLRIGSSVGNAFIEYNMGKLGTGIVYQVREDLFDRLQKTSMNYFDKVHSGDIISIVTNDVDQLSVVFSGQLSGIISDVFNGLLVIGIMFSLSWEMAFLSFLMIPIFLIVAKFFTKKVKPQFKKVRKKIAQVTSVAEQNISGMKVIQAYGKQDEAAKEFDNINKMNQQTLFKARRIMAFMMPVVFLLFNILSAIITMYGGFSIINGVTLLNNVISFGTVTIFGQYLFQMFTPIIEITMFSQMAQSTLAASERIYNLLNEETEIPDPVIPKHLAQNAENQVQGKIEFDKVNFAYRKRETKEELAALHSTSDEKIKSRKNKFNENKDKKQQSFKIGESKKNKMIFQKQKKIENQIRNIYSTPEQILSLARHLDIQLKGENHTLQKGSGSEGSLGGTPQIGGNNSGKSNKMSLDALPRNKILEILGSPRVPKSIYDQFSPTVKLIVDEDRLIREYKTHTGRIIDNVSLKIEPEKTIAIVGPTGAGKTTLIKLISRFYDLENGNGKIKVDDLNIKDLLKDELRSAIGMVPQDSFLFTGTILENLYYGMPEGTKMEVNDKLLDISKFLGLHNFIETMTDKYNTYLKENASNLSVGQRQLIAFARVLMNDPKILILDEATSAVDPYTENLIQDALDKAKSGRTTIIIAHRLSTIKNADEIFVMEKGKIVEHGSHDELIALKGNYANLVQMQAKNIATS